MHPDRRNGWSYPETAGYGVMGDIEGRIRRCAAGALAHFRRIGSWWVMRIRSCWSRGGLPNRLVSAGFLVAGILALVLLAHLLLYLIPILILLAFISIIVSAIRANGGVRAPWNQGGTT